MTSYRIQYSRLDHDYTCYVTIDDVEQTIGSRPDHATAEKLCREYLYDHFNDAHTPEKAARIAAAAFEPQEADEDKCPNCRPGRPCYDHEPTGAQRWIVEPEPSEPAFCRCGEPAAWEVRDGLLLALVCEKCYQVSFVNNKLLWSAWEATELPTFYVTGPTSDLPGHALPRVLWSV